MAVVSENKYSRSACQSNTCASISIYRAPSISDQLQADPLACLKYSQNSDVAPIILNFAPPRDRSREFQQATGLTLPEMCWVRRNFILLLWEKDSTAGQWHMEALGSALKAEDARFFKDNKHLRFRITLKLWKRLKDNITKNHID